MEGRSAHDSDATRVLLSVEAKELRTGATTAAPSEQLSDAVRGGTTDVPRVPALVRS